MLPSHLKLELHKPQYKYNKIAKTDQQEGGSLSDFSTVKPEYSEVYDGKIHNP